MTADTNIGIMCNILCGSSLVKGVISWLAIGTGQWTVDQWIDIREPNVALQLYPSDLPEMSQLSARWSASAQDALAKRKAVQCYLYYGANSHECLYRVEGTNSELVLQRYPRYDIIFEVTFEYVRDVNQVQAQYPASTHRISAEELFNRTLPNALRIMNKRNGSFRICYFRQGIFSICRRVVEVANAQQFVCKRVQLPYCGEPTDSFIDRFIRDPNCTELIMDGDWPHRLSLSREIKENVFSGKLTTLDCLNGWPLFTPSDFSKLCQITRGGIHIRGAYKVGSEGELWKNEYQWSVHHNASDQSVYCQIREGVAFFIDWTPLDDFPYFNYAKM
uniref:Uncharacterized protein n=1 Tax=Steinernema glaseri TaxID=37863 RepID=A0A1I7Z1X4_9BILA